ncbi:hypothetical protein GCM10009647_019130 [Streptomyces sanglieri]
MAGELVLGDGPFAFHGNRAALVGGPVGLLLDLLAGRGAQGALHLGLGADRHHPYRDHIDPGGGQSRFGGEPCRDPVAYRCDTVDQRLGQRGPGQHVQGVLLGGLGEQGGDLLQRRTAPDPGVRVDREVQPGGRLGRVADPVRHGGLHGHVLEVGGAGVERHRQLPVVHRDFRECGAQ